MTEQTPAPETDAARPGLTGFVRRHKPLAAVAGVLVVGLLAGGASAVGSTGGDPQRHADVTGTPRLMAPRDGALLVAGTKVAQMAGACDGHSCYHVAPARPATVTVTSRTATLPLKAGQSTLFSVGAFNTVHRSQTVPIGIRGQGLALDQMSPGSYLVTVAGRPNGGMWQFRLVVTKAGK